MLRVLTYHRIGEPSQTPELDPALVSATPEAFRLQMEHLWRRYNPVSLDEIYAAFDEGKPLPPRPVHVTIDDGYTDFAEVAWPILRRLGIPVTLFVPTAFPDGQRSFWWDRLHRAASGNGSAELLDRVAEALSLPRSNGRSEFRTALRRLPHDAAETLIDQVCPNLAQNGNGHPVTVSTTNVLGWDHLRELRDQGVTFGAHTRNHVALSCVDEGSVRDEIRQSMDDLTRELGSGRWPIAYPYGLCDATVARIAREVGCRLGFTSEDGLNRPGATDPLRLSRSNITLRTSPRLFMVRMWPWCAPVDRWRHRKKHALSVS
jgi:peptidoglycan/xylan/chitin deacetylase (PgdA/CDA1 family)